MKEIPLTRLFLRIFDRFTPIGMKNYNQQPVWKNHVVSSTMQGIETFPFDVARCVRIEYRLIFMD